MVKTRPLKISDKEDILDIAENTWEGHDWIPAFFESWLEDSTCHTLAIEEDGRVAALANLRLIEKGTTGWMEGLRVHPKYRGRGYATFLTHRLVEMAQKLKVKRLRYTTGTVNEESIHLASKIGMKRIFTLGVYFDSNLDRIQWKLPDDRLEILDIDSVLNQIVASDLIPNNVFVLDWKAYDANFEGFMAFDDLEIWTHKSTTQLTSLSLGTLRHDMNGPVWAFTIYSQDRNLFLELLSKNLSLARERKLDRIMMIFPFEFYETLYNTDWVDKEEEEFGIILFEKQL